MSCILQELNPRKKKKRATAVCPFPPTEASFGDAGMRDRREEPRPSKYTRERETRRDQGAVILRLDGDSEAFRKHSQPSPQHGMLLQTHTHTHTKDRNHGSDPGTVSRPPYLLTAASHSLSHNMLNMCHIESWRGACAYVGRRLGCTRRRSRPARRF